MRKGLLKGQSHEKRAYYMDIGMRKGLLKGQWHDKGTVT